MVSGGHVGSSASHRYRRHLQPPPPPMLTPFHLLEISVISAQDLKLTCGGTRAYAQAWVDPNYKLRTQVDRIGNNNPYWNDKFVFQVDDNYLRSDTAAVTVVIRKASRIGAWHDSVIGMTRLIISTVVLSPTMQLMALQVRRPKSLRPEGMLNLGVAVHACVGARRELMVGRRTRSRKEVEMQNSGEVGRWVVEKEREELQFKLEKWRKEMAPAMVDPHEKAAAVEKRGRKKAEGKWFGCFCGGATIDR